MEKMRKLGNEMKGKGKGKDRNGINGEKTKTKTTEKKIRMRRNGVERITFKTCKKKSDMSTKRKK